MTTIHTRVSNTDLAWLNAAIESADEWRGLYLGDPDGSVNDHDARIKHMRAAYDKVRALVREVRTSQSLAATLRENLERKPQP